MSPLKRSPRRLRLLPCVVILGASLLILKTTDLVHGAFAQPGDNSALAANSDPVPANKDYAGEDEQASSASEVDVLNSLSKRRHELDTRENQLDTQANILAAAEKRVDAKIAELKQLKNDITQLLGARDDAQQKQIAALIKSYGPDGMKPANAAAIFNNLPDEVLIPVAQGMKPDDLGPILAKMNPEAAQRLTLKLLNRLTLPQTVDAANAQLAAAPSAPAAQDHNGTDAKSDKPQSPAAPLANAPAKAADPKS